MLTVGDGTESANLNFGNFRATFEFASDGHGGTDIFDPPEQSSDKESSFNGLQFGQAQAINRKSVSACQGAPVCAIR